MRLMVFFIVLIFSAATSSAADFSDDFRLGKLDDKWCGCQIDNTVPVTFDFDPTEKGDQFARITVAPSIRDNTCDPNECKDTLIVGSGTDSAIMLEDEMLETLGPSFIEGPSGRATISSSGCKPSGEGCIQRQELRFAESFEHASDSAHEYMIRFRMPVPVKDKVSTRWVTAQWKQEPLPSYGLGWSPSPFLAQRYDGGVLHLTVQDENCRCIVASAPAPDQTFAWKDGTVSNCKLTYPKEDEGKACTSALTAHYGAHPVLDPPVSGWTEMRYLFKAGREQSDFIEVQQDGRFIVRISGRIGYEPASGTDMKTKFKIGHYRNFLPTQDLLEVDLVTVSPK